MKIYICSVLGGKKLAMKIYEYQRIVQCHQTQPCPSHCTSLSPELVKVTSKSRASSPSRSPWFSGMEISGKIWEDLPKKMGTTFPNNYEAQILKDTKSIAIACHSQRKTSESRGAGYHRAPSPP